MQFFFSKQKKKIIYNLNKKDSKNPKMPKQKNKNKNETLTKNISQLQQKKTEKIQKLTKLKKLDVPKSFTYKHEMGEILVDIRQATSNERQSNKQ